MNGPLFRKPEGGESGPQQQELESVFFLFSAQVGKPISCGDPEKNTWL